MDTVDCTGQQLQIRLLGGFQLTWNGEPVAAFSNTRLQRLLAYLLLHQEAPQSRQTLASIFWPDSNDSQARTNLRNALHLLRSHLPLVAECIYSDNKRVYWKGDAPAYVDLLIFESLVREATDAADGNAAQNRFAQAIQLYKGDLLPDCYEEWILPIREGWRQYYFQTLQQLAQRLEEQRKYRQAITVAQKILQIDPLQENHYALLMSLQAADGDRAAALRTYHSCQTVLLDELGVEPGPATQSIYERLLNLDPEETPTKNLPRSGSALIGREEEWKTLQQTWDRSTNQQAEMLILAGEAGIGKSRLAIEWSTMLARQGIITAVAHCYSAGGRLAFAPVQAWLRVPQIQQCIEQIPLRHQQALVPLLPELGDRVKQASIAVTGAESMQRVRLFEAVAVLLAHVKGPLLLVLDDIQWCDQDTLEWIEHLFQSVAQHQPPLQMLLVATMRTGEVGSEHPVQKLKYTLGRKDQLHEISLHRYDLALTGKLVASLAGKGPTDVELAQIFADTEGNPLFIEEMVRSLAQSAAMGHSTDVEGATSPPLPPKIQSIVEGRLLRLSPTARALADIAAVLGRVFTTGLLVAVTGDDEDTLLHSLDELWQQQIIREYGQGIAWSDDAYDFAHDKLRDVVYQTLSPMRRRQLHRRTAQALADQPKQSGELISSQVASHFERGGHPLLAIQWYQKAAEAATQLSASQEALIHLDHALGLLAGLPSAGQESLLLELSIQMERAPALLATKGYAAIEAEEALTQAWEISQTVSTQTEGEPAGDDVQQRFKIMWGLSRFYQVQPNFEKGMEIAEQMVSLAEESGVAALRLEAYTALGTYHLHQGSFDQSVEFLDRSLALYNPTQHGHHAYGFGQDPKVVSLVYSAWALFCQGSTEQATARADKALAWSESIDHPYSRVIAQTYAAVQQQFLGNATACLEMAESASTLATEHGFRLWIAMSNFLRGWSLCRLGNENEANIERGLEMMQQSAELYRDTGAKLGACYFAALLAETLAQTGQIETSSFVIQLALAEFAETQERWCEARLHYIHGTILQQLDQTKEAEIAFDKAASVAKAQGAGWWLEQNR